MVADSRHREKTFKIEKNIFESRKIKNSKKKLWNLEKKIKIEKNILESRKTFQNREKCFFESKNILLQESRKNLELNGLEFNEPLHKIKEEIKEIYYIT